MSVCMLGFRNWSRLSSITPLKTSNFENISEIDFFCDNCWTKFKSASFSFQILFDNDLLNYTNTNYHELVKL